MAVTVFTWFQEFELVVTAFSQILARAVACSRRSCCLELLRVARRCAGARTIARPCARRCLVLRIGARRMRAARTSQILPVAVITPAHAFVAVDVWLAGPSTQDLPGLGVTRTELAVRAGVSA